MPDVHPNVRLLEQLDMRNIAAARELFAEDAVWHYHNPNLPELQGDYTGIDGIGSLFEAFARTLTGSLKITPVSIEAVGPELVVTTTRNSLIAQGRPVALDVVVVWRVVDGRIVEVWDIVPGTPSEDHHAEH